ncbi:response regulator transcription factor [Labrys okinawensis]|uniref:helix-turn-helix transcriptional regulator n=1 Tax=Labrys okinawensis TaxID=346911 RepID=UPI0039BCFA05
MDENVNSTAIQLINRNSLMRGCMETVLASEFPQETVEGFANLSDWFRAHGGSSLRRGILIMDQATFEQLQTIYHGPKSEMPRIILISDCHNVDDRARASRFGVKGWICSRDSVEVAVKATRIVLLGGKFVRPRAEAEAVAVGPLHVDRACEASPALGELTGATPRQLAIIEAVGLGLSNAEIAARLRMRERTVKAHLRKIMKRLCVKTTACLPGLCGDLLRYSSKMQARQRFRIELQQLCRESGFLSAAVANGRITYH